MKITIDMEPHESWEDEYTLLIIKKAIRMLTSLGFINVAIGIDEKEEATS